MSDWKTCPDCGRDLPVNEMAAHRCRAEEAQENRMVTADDLAARTAGRRWPHDPESMHRKHRAFVAERQAAAERVG